MSFLFGPYILIPKKKIGHNQKGTTLEPLGIFGPLIFGSFRVRVSDGSFTDRLRVAQREVRLEPSTPQFTSIEGLMVSICHNMGYLKG